ANWPRLHTLQLCIGQSDSYGCDVEFGDLQWIFDGENLDNVRHLGLANSNFADGIAEALAGSKILDRLEPVDLSRGTLGERGVAAILAAPGFAKLKRLDLSYSYISPELCRQLGKLGPVVVLDGQQSEREDDRYCQITE